MGGQAPLTEPPFPVETLKPMVPLTSRGFSPSGSEEEDFVASEQSWGDPYGPPVCVVIQTSLLSVALSLKQGQGRSQQS